MISPLIGMLVKDAIWSRKIQKHLVLLLPIMDTTIVKDLDTLMQVVEDVELVEEATKDVEETLTLVAVKLMQVEVKVVPLDHFIGLFKEFDRNNNHGYVLVVYSLGHSFSLFFDHPLLTFTTNKNSRFCCLLLFGIYLRSCCN